MRLVATLLMVALNMLPAQDLEEGELPLQISLYGQITTDEGEVAENAQLEIYLNNGVRNQEIPESFRLFRATTDQDGRYQLQLLVFEGWESATFTILRHDLNAIRYKVPYTADMTGYLSGIIEQDEGDIRKRYSFLMQSREGWQQEELLIERYGAESDKGRLLRREGMPDRIKPFENRNGDAGELWFYYEAGFVVRFIGDERDLEFIFKPTLPPGQ